MLYLMISLTVRHLLKRLEKSVSYQRYHEYHHQKYTMWKLHHPIRSVDASDYSYIRLYSSGLISTRDDIEIYSQHDLCTSSMRIDHGYSTIEIDENTAHDDEYDHAHSMLYI